MNLFLEFFSIIIGRWFLGGIGHFVRRMFGASKINNTSKGAYENLDTDGTYDRLVGFFVVFLILVLAKIMI